MCIIDCMCCPLSLKTWISAGLDDIKSHFQPSLFYDSVNTYIQKNYNPAKRFSPDGVSGQAIIFTAELTEY